MKLDQPGNTPLLFAAPTLTLRLLASYLGAAAVPVLREGLTGGGAGMAAALHVIVLGAVLALLRAGGAPRRLASWIPLVLWPALYAEMPLVIAGLGTSVHDAAVQGWERALFGGQPAWTLAAALPSAALSELLHLGYLAYYPLIYLPPLLLIARGRQAAFADTVLAITAVWLLCLTLFAFYPVAGPRYLTSEPPGIPHGPVRSFVLWVLERGSSRGTAFPSSHVAVSVVQSLMALRLQRPVGVVASIGTALLAVGAVYGGFHYAIDVVTGTAVGVIVFYGISVRLRRAAAVSSVRWPAAPSYTDVAE